MLAETITYVATQNPGDQLIAYTPVSQVVLPALARMQGRNPTITWRGRDVSTNWQKSDEFLICQAATQAPVKAVAGIMAGCALATEDWHCLLDLMGYDYDAKRLMTQANHELLTGRVLGYFEAMAALYSTSNYLNLDPPDDYRGSGLWLVAHLLAQKGGPSEETLKSIESKLSNAISVFVKGTSNDTECDHDKFLDQMFYELRITSDESWERRSLQQIVVDQLTIKDWSARTTLERLEQRGAEPPR